MPGTKIAGYVALEYVWVFIVSTHTCMNDDGPNSIGRADAVLCYFDSLVTVIPAPSV